MERRLQHFDYTGGLLEQGDHEQLWPLLKAYQLERNPTAREKDYPDSTYRSMAEHMLKNENSRVFGLYKGQTMIGYSVLENMHRDTASFAESYLEPEFRGRRLSSMLYDMRFVELMDKPDITAAKLQVSSDNYASYRSAVGQQFQRHMSYADVDFLKQPLEPLRAFFHSHERPERYGNIGLDHLEASHS